MTGMEATEDQIKAFKNNMKIMDDLIGQKKYLTGNELTIADLSILANTVMLDLTKYDVSEYTNFNRWRAQLKNELPYYEEVNHFEEAYLQDIIKKHKEHMQKKQ